MYKNYVAGAIIAAAMLPAFASAQTVGVSAQIQTLLDQIHSLQLQIKALIASSTLQFTGASTTPPLFPPGQVGKMACIQLNRNLGVGSRGDDVKKLQEILDQDDANEFNASATGFFGPATARAMMKFQTRLGIASSTNGTVGPLTRGFFERACGKGLGKGDDNRDGGMMNPKAIAGTITAVASSSITVQAANASTTRVVNFTASTTIEVFATATSTPATGTAANLTVGATVLATGTPNADGSLGAADIKIGLPLPPSQSLLQIFQFDKFGKMMEDMMGGGDRGRGQGGNGRGGEDN